MGWASLVVVLDWHTKKIVGHHAGLRGRTPAWLEGLHGAVHRQFPRGVQGQGLSLMSDNGRQLTSVAFMNACATLGITQPFTSYNNTEGNADTERMTRTLKEERLGRREWTSIRELEHAVAALIEP